MSNCETARKQEIESVEKLRALGCLSVAGGVQIDINTVPKRIDKSTYVDGHKCDHNCLRVDGSGYDCPASSTINKGLSGKFPREDRLAQAIISTAQGVRIANEMLREQGYFDLYCDSFAIPTGVKRAMLLTLEQQTIQTNLFGGNPEMYDQLIPMVTRVASIDSNVTFNLTTTGRKTLVDEQWLNNVVNSPISSISLSCDNIDVILLKKCGQMSDSELRLLWKQVLNSSPKNGSQQKAIEAICTARKLSRLTMPFLFNLVVHQGNIQEVIELTHMLSDQFPQARINPFPAQSSMDETEPTFSPSNISTWERIIEWAIDTHLTNNAQIKLAPRIHYWLMLKAVTELYKLNSYQTVRALSGYDVWNCFDRAGSARYVQIGASTHPWNQLKSEAGGHLGCFWNETVTVHNSQVWDQTPEEVGNYIVSNIQKIALLAPNKCSGCIMPRLTFDLYSQEIGMNPILIPHYLDIRKQYLGF